MNALLALNPVVLPVREPNGREIGAFLAHMNSEDQAGVFNALADEMDAWEAGKGSDQLTFIADHLSSNAIRLIEDLAGFARAAAQ